MASQEGSVRSSLPTTPPRETRAVGGPIALRLLAGYFGLSLLGWLAAVVALAVHLLALGFLPLAVGGGACHLLPVMLRNPLRHERRLVIALPLLALGAWLAAPGIAYDVRDLLWPGAALLGSGFALVLSNSPSLPGSPICHQDCPYRRAVSWFWL
jgi:hypothetical protein